MSERKPLGSRVPAPKGKLPPPPTPKTDPEVEALRRQLDEAKAEAANSAEKAKKASAQAAKAERRAQEEAEKATAARQKAAEAARRPPMLERTYSGTMANPHVRRDGQKTRRTSFTLTRYLELSMDYLVQTSHGAFRNRTALLEETVRDYVETKLDGAEKKNLDAYVEAVLKREGERERHLLDAAE